MRLSLHAILWSSLVVAGGAAAGWLLRTRRQPDHSEAQRRALVSARGRVIEGFVSDYHDGFVVYSWSWQGVEYESSQDLRSLLHMLPNGSIIGPVSVKFLANDPANSIVAAEGWSGFRKTGLYPKQD